MPFFFEVIGLIWLCFTLGMIILGCSMSTALLGPIVLVIDFYQTWKADKEQRKKYLERRKNCQ